jgi:hypothetical protein
MLGEIEAAGLAERVEFTDLLQQGCRRWIWQYLLPDVPFDPVRDADFARINIQVNMPERLAQLARRGAYAATLREDLRRATG